jgi:hypothetical protein
MTTPGDPTKPVDGAAAGSGEEFPLSPEVVERVKHGPWLFAFSDQPGEEYCGEFAEQAAQLGG